MLKRILVVGIILYLFTSLVHAAAISGFKVRGNFFISNEEILKEVQSKVGEELDIKKLDSDVKLVYSIGYFENVSATFETTAKGVEVIFQVWENQLVRKIEFKGNTIFTRKELLSLIESKRKKVLNFRKLRSDIEKITSYYKDQGYTLARIIDVSTEYGTLSFDISEGFVEKIHLKGNDQTKDYVIYREMDLKEGDPFNEKVLGKDLRRVFNLGFFSEIVPQFEPGSTRDKVVLILNVKESRANTLNFGGGYGEREGWFGFIDLSANNLFGTAQGLLVRGQMGQELTTYQLKYNNPWFFPEYFGKRTAYTLRLWNTMGRDIYLTLQDEFHVGFDMSFGKKLRDDFSVSYSFGAENVSPRGSATFEAYSSQFVGVSLSYDTRDFWMNPTEGVFHTLSIKNGWKHTTAVTSYLKLGVDMNVFIPLAERQVLATHLGLGQGFGDVPLGELYWAGGPNTVRGYLISETKKGTRKVIYNLEYRYTFNDVFQGVIFYDYGDAWDKGAPNPSDFIAGWGPGIRLNTPLGPIRLDYGMPLTKPDGGGILHFSIGHAF
jgi:outer membrane protein insertion porin family